MRSLFSVLLIALFSSAAFAVISADNEYIINHSSYAADKTQMGTLISQTKNLLVAKYSYAVQGGATTSDISLVLDLNKPRQYAILPNKAIVLDVFVDVLTQPTAAGATTISLKANSTGDLLAPVNTSLLTASRVAGIPKGATIATWLKLTAAKTVKANVTNVNGNLALAAGKFNVYITYILGD